MTNLNKYKQNLSIVYVDNVRYIKSYQTLVARIEENEIIQLGYWSMTTQKHINYVASVLNLPINKASV